MVRRVTIYHLGLTTDFATLVEMKKSSVLDTIAITIFVCYKPVGTRDRLELSRPELEPAIFSNTLVFVHVVAFRQ